MANSTSIRLEHGNIIVTKENWTKSVSIPVDECLEYTDRHGLIEFYYSDEEFVRLSYNQIFDMLPKYVPKTEQLSMFS